MTRLRGTSRPARRIRAVHRPVPTAPPCLATTEKRDVTAATGPCRGCLRVRCPVETHSPAAYSGFLPCRTLSRILDYDGLKPGHLTRRRNLVTRALLLIYGYQTGKTTEKSFRRVPGARRGRSRCGRTPARTGTIEGRVSFRSARAPRFATPDIRQIHADVCARSDRCLG